MCSSAISAPSKQRLLRYSTPGRALYSRALGLPPLHVAEAQAVYRPRHPERTSFYHLIDEHFDRYKLLHEERFEQKSGPLRTVVARTVEAYLDCGRLENGFARIRCPSCRGEHLLAFSCQTRNFCPSCQAKRSALFAEHLESEVLAPVPHRHIIFTVPRALRGIFERERSLLGLLARAAFDVARKAFGTFSRNPDARPGMVASIQTFGSFANFNPHIHALVTDGLLLPGGEFIPLPHLDEKVLDEMFRRIVLKRLRRKRRLSEQFMNALLSWRHSGFSVYARQVVHASNQDHTAHIARYLTRAPVRLDAVGKTSDGMVALTTPPDPKTGATARAFDPIEWVHALCTQIPDQGQHLVRYYGAYANRSRKRFQAAEPPPPPGPQHSPALEEQNDPFTRNRRRSWARLMRKLFLTDPLLCPTCRVEMKVVGMITEPSVIDKILKHVRAGHGHNPFEPRAPPAA